MEELLYPLETSWIVLLVAGALALFLLLEQGRSLPAQNIVLIAIILLVAEGFLEIPMAKYSKVAVTDPRWVFLAGAALLWLAIILSARRLGQLILRPWRRDGFYGLWLIAVSAVLTASFQYAQPCFNPISISQGRAAVLAVVRGLATVILLAGLSPWFIRKRPASHKREPSELAQQPKNEAQ
jgi:hypothetical protein